MEKANTTESGIRIFSLIRRIGSILTIFIFFYLLSMSVYHTVNNKYFLLPTLKEIHKSGITTIPTVEEDYEKKVDRNYNVELKFKYSFKTDKRQYKNTYSLNRNLPKNSNELSEIFTVHYLKDFPDKNSLNIKNEITLVEKRINNSSTLWFFLKILGSIILGIILFNQILALISEIRNINEPIKTPNYLKK